MYDNLTDNEIRSEATAIVRGSSSPEEIAARLRSELGYPYQVAIASYRPSDKHDIAAALCGLGGLTTKDGTLVMVSLHGHDGIISI